MMLPAPTILPDSMVGLALRAAAIRLTEDLPHPHHMGTRQKSGGARDGLCMEPPYGAPWCTT